MQMLGRDTIQLSKSNQTKSNRMLSGLLFMLLLCCYFLDVVLESAILEGEKEIVLLYILIQCCEEE